MFKKSRLTLKILKKKLDFISILDVMLNLAEVQFNK